MRHALLSVDEVHHKILDGEPLLLAADEQVLRQLPQGAWMGGTIPYFMTDRGGLFSHDQVYVTEMPPQGANVTIRYYQGDELAQVYADIPEHGVGLILMPASSPAHLSFALHVHQYPHFAARPLIGWVSGVQLEDLGRITPKIFDGRTCRAYEDGALMTHFALPDTAIADINIINIFEQGDGDTITFDEDAFQARTARINGQPRDFAAYIAERQLDTRLPLVADYNGAMINTSFQQVDAGTGVSFYAPVFKGLEYKQAAPIDNYVQHFLGQIPPRHKEQAIAFSCNCILNYLYAELEGKRTGAITGPMTFGEIAYQLVNQTLVYLSIEEVGS